MEIQQIQQQNFSNIQSGTSFAQDQHCYQLRNQHLGQKFLCFFDSSCEVDQICSNCQNASSQCIKGRCRSFCVKNQTANTFGQYFFNEYSFFDDSNSQMSFKSGSVQFQQLSFHFETENENPKTQQPKLVKKPAKKSFRKRMGCCCNKTRCVKKNCKCYRNGNSCSELCRCLDCGNFAKERSECENSNEHLDKLLDLDGSHEGQLSMQVDSSEPESEGSEGKIEEEFEQIEDEIWFEGAEFI